MALTRITIPVYSIAQITCDFDYIRIYRAETEHGTYSEITTTGTMLELCSEQDFYDYDDEDGSEYYWYKWKYFNSTGSYSKFYGPIRGYSPYTTYCTFEDVKRILRSTREDSRIHFSGTYKNLRPGKNNTSSIRLKEVSISQDYAGQERHIITFTSTTDFTVEVGEDRNIAKRLIGTGNTSTDFVSDDGSVRINSDDWVDTPAAIDDTIEFQTYSHMSTNNALRFIQDAEVLVDVIVEENVNFTDEKNTELRFTRSAVPKAIKAATSRFAAFFIWTTIYNEQSQAGLPQNINDITVGLRRENDLSTWAKQALRYLEGYIKKYTEKFDPDSGNPVTSAPRWRANEPLLDAVGVAYVGDGLKLPRLDYFKERANMNYEGLLDYDLLLTGMSNVWRDPSYYGGYLTDD